MTVLSRPTSTGFRIPSGAAAGLLGGLAAASLVELLILRTFTRTAIHIPAAPALHEPFEVLSFAGRYAYFISIALLVSGLPLAATFLWRAGAPAARVTAAAALAFLAAAALASGEALSRSVLDAAMLASILLLSLSAALARGPRAGAPLALFGVAFLAAGAHTWLQTAGQRAAVDGQGNTLLLAAEITAVAFAVASPALARRRPSRGALIAGSAAALITFGFFSAGGGSTARILLLWDAGLEGALPAVAYALAAGALAVAALSLYRARDLTTLVGLALLIAGGVGLHNTYQTGLVVAAFVALQLAALPRPALPPAR
jgi:hypothetical protein